MNIFRVLTERLDAYNFEGCEHLEEKMRNHLNQTPHIMTNLIEISEEVRMEYCNILKIILFCENEELLIPFINYVVDINRAMIMDPYREV